MTKIFSVYFLVKGHIQMIWKYSKWDSIPCLITLFQLALSFWLAATWETRTLTQNLLFIPLCIFLFWYNGLVASHSFVHHPWFTSERLNQLYLALNSINIGLPQIHYRYEHLHHHHYGNDRPNSEGITKDPTSTFAYGKNGQHEHVVSYCLLGLFRTDLMESFREIYRKGDGKQLRLELTTCIVSLMIYLALSWQYVLFILIPTLYWGWVLEHLENYYEHFGGTPENRYANSSSYYGCLYNLLFCNEGYHQEHHLRPNVHWTKRPQTRQEFSTELDKVDRVILSYPPVLGFLHHQNAMYKRQSTQQSVVTVKS